MSAGVSHSLPHLGMKEGPQDKLDHMQPESASRHVPLGRSIVWAGRPKTWRTVAKLERDNSAPLVSAVQGASDDRQARFSNPRILCARQKPNHGSCPAQAKSIPCDEVLQASKQYPSGSSGLTVSSTSDNPRPTKLSTPELAALLRIRGAPVWACVERGDLLQMADAWLLPQGMGASMPPVPNIDYPRCSRHGGRDRAPVASLLDILRKPPIGRAFWAFFPCSGRNTLRSRVTHGLFPVCTEMSRLSQGVVCSMSDEELTTEVIERWRKFEDDVMRQANIYRATRNMNRVVLRPLSVSAHVLR